MKVNWTDAARAQLRDIHSFVARASPQYAKKVVDRLTRRSQQIGAFPRSGRIAPEANDVNIREVLEGPYRIIYHILEDEKMSLLSCTAPSSGWKNHSTLIRVFVKHHRTMRSSGPREGAFVFPDSCSARGRLTRR